MLIPLDYYRILGLPIQATAEQLQQAHRDRTLQLPRREYSEVSIVARRQLLDEACAVLSDSDQRQAYDANFLAKTYDRESEAGIAGKQQRSKTSADAATALQDDAEADMSESGVT
ncbi:MAG: J domain-containing protein, partial [Microcoleus sp.]